MLLRRTAGRPELEPINIKVPCHSKMMDGESIEKSKNGNDYLIILVYLTKVFVSLIRLLRRRTSQFSKYK